VSKKLLLADDSVTIQKVIELTFADEDIEVIAVSNGSQAISLAPVERPDIVLADVGMPERDGYEVAAFIKRTPGLSHIPVLLLTGAFEPIDEGRAKAAGCDGVLVKPFEPQMVINRVKDLIAGKRPLTTGFQPATVPEAIAKPAAPLPANEYFNRLDAALGTKEPEKPLAFPTAADLASELANWQPEATIAPPRADAPIAPPTSAPAPTSASAGADAAVGKPSTSAEAPSASAPAPPTSVPTLTEAFAALLAAERGTVAPPAALTEPATREDVVEQVTRRVIERMTDTAVRDTVVEVAERLVREEILRIKNQPK
jgi:CheY-like chemotaxis protein